jgi:hypothetical protein
MQDSIPEKYVLLSLGDKQVDTTDLRVAYEHFGAPVSEVRVNSTRVRDLYGFNLIVLRPDMHVVWRGNRAPANAGEIASLSTGHGPL